MARAPIAAAMVVAALQLVAIPSMAATRYVAPGGVDDGNNCLDAQNPCGSVPRAIQQTSDGDRIELADGSYDQGLVEGSGCAFDGGATHVFLEDKSCASQGCVIEAANVTSPPSVTLVGGSVAVCMIDSPGWTLRGLQFEGPGKGPKVQRSHNLVIEDVIVNYRDPGSGTGSRYQDTDGVTLRRYRLDNVVWDQGGCNVSDQAKYQQYFDKAHNVLIEDSYIGHDQHILNVKGGSTGFTMRRSIVEHFTGHGMQLTGAYNVLLENNVFRADTSCDESTQRLIGPRLVDIYEVSNLTVRNNTVVGHGYLWQNFVNTYEQQQQCLANGYQDDICDRTDIRIYNNLVYDIRPSGSNSVFVKLISSPYTTQSGLAVEGNWYSKGPAETSRWAANPGDCGNDWAGWNRNGQGCSAWGGTNNVGVGSIFVDPPASASTLFVDYAGQDYRPIETASFVNAGVNGSDSDGVQRCASEDFFGRARIDGSCDIGAFEFDGATQSNGPTGEVVVIACTEAALVEALQQVCPEGDATIRFDCQNATIPISLSSDRDQRKIRCDDVVIDGEDRDITFELDPPCHTEFPDSCPDRENGEWFVSMEGNRGEIKNLTVSSFWEGIHAGAGVGNVVRNVEFLRPCDDAFTNRAGAVGTVFRNNTIHDACDKALQLYGRRTTDTASIDPSSPDYFDARIESNTFIDCKQPLRTTQHGRFLVESNAFREEDPQGSLFRCDGPRFSGSDVAIYFDGNQVEDCRRGVRVYEGAHIAARYNVFRNNELRGLAVFGSARASIWNNLFESNGGGSSGEAYYGGVAVADSAQVDAGGGSLTIDGQVLQSVGQNSFLGNRSSGDPTLDVQNLTSSTVTARFNFWGDTDPSDQVQGSVDFQQWLTSPPGTELPPQVPNLHREDDVP